MRTVGHDLRNRLGVVKNSAYFLAMKLGKGDDKISKHLRLIQQEIGEMERMITDLMDLAWVRQSTGTPLDLNAGLSQSLAEAGFPRGVELEIEFAPQLPPVRADGDQLRRILRAIWLLVGSHSAAGRVRVRLAAEQQRARLSVLDHRPGAGHGLSDPFDPQSALRLPHIGLSLAAARALAEGQGGSLFGRQIEPEGMESVLTLPLLGEEARPAGGERARR